MNIKRNILTFLTFTILSSLVIINIKNPIKTKFSIFTSTTENISLGNLITFSFLTGLTTSSVLTLIALNRNYKSKEDKSNFDQEAINYNNTNREDIKKDRPPERDIRESQPTISVNYRFIDPENINLKNNGKTQSNEVNEDDNDWTNLDNDW